MARTLLHRTVSRVAFRHGIAGSLVGLAIAIQPALAQDRTVWQGSGQVVSGHGQGASVHLVVETTPNRIRTQSGPALDASFTHGQQTVSNEAGTWQIESHGDRLGVTLYRDNQIIRYHLSPSASAESTSVNVEEKDSDDKSQNLTAQKERIVARALLRGK